MVKTVALIGDCLLTRLVYLSVFLGWLKSF